MFIFRRRGRGCKFSDADLVFFASQRHGLSASDFQVARAGRGIQS